jgi:hypothetical protein
MEENKDKNSKREFLKTLVKSAAGVVLLPQLANTTEALGGIHATPILSFSPTPTSSTTPTPSTSPTPSITPTPSISVTPSITSTPMPTPSPSEIVSSVEKALKAEGIEVGTFSPNPTSDRSFLIVSTVKPISIQVEVYDVNAKSVFRKDIVLRAGSNSVEVELPNGQPGYYQVRIDFSGKIVTRRLISL